MKIAIDCRALRKPPSGIPNYLVTAINSMVLQQPDWEFYLMANEPFHPELQGRLIHQRNVQVLIKPLPILKGVGILWYVFKVYFLLKRLKPDLFWGPNFLLPPVVPKGIKTLVTVHDCVPKRFRSTMSWINRVFFDVLNDQSVKKADKLWAVSEYTKSEIELYYPDRACKNIFVGSSIDQGTFKQVPVPPQEKEAILKKYNLSSKFLLFVGTLEPRKNLSFLLSLMPTLARQHFTLLVIGGKGWGNTGISTIVKAEGYPADSVSFAGFVATEELVKIYNVASVYVSTSLNEGFGLPQMEAMACGCPVVSPHNSAMIEVVEGAGEMVSTWNPQDWIDAINKVYADRNRYVRGGLNRVREQSWSTIVSRLADYVSQ